MIFAAFSDGKTGDQRDQQDVERIAQTQKEMQNCYRDVACPKCGCSLVRDGDEFFVFLSDPEGLDCRICNSRLVRQGDTLTVFEGKPVAVGSS